MDQRLKEVASSGDIDSLYSIIQEDAYILDLIDQVPFVDTPLHISAAAGHTHFSLEIMRLKPSFAKKLNPEGYTPLHLALQNDQTDMIFRLVNIDRDLIRVQGREGLTPLHIAASGGKADLLSKFLVCCPKSIKELTIHEESALHIAVKNGDIESLKILLEWVQKTCLTTVLNWADEEGNNIMHLAALGDHIDIVKLLIKKVEMKSKNEEGLTALNIIKDRGFLEDRELRKMLNHTHILKEPRFVLLTLIDLAANIFRLLVLFLKRVFITDHSEIINMSKEDRNAILVVSVLIATATYQALLDPPEKNYGKNTKYWVENFGEISITSIFLFRYFNTIAFFASMTEIFLHLPSGIGYTLHLVLPLVICYTLLVLYGWIDDFLLHFVLLYSIVIVFLILKVPIIRQKISGELRPKKMRKFPSLLKGNPSLAREVSEMKMKIRSSGMP